MKQIPESILLSALFLCHSLDAGDADTHWYVSMHCCMFRISECMFRDICHHLHAVILYEPSFDPLSSIDPHIDFTRPFFDQGRWFHPDKSTINHVLNVHGIFRFYHKSFYDFLRDPTRSGSFCVTTPTIYRKVIDQFIQSHHHYASSYAINGSSVYWSPCICPWTYLFFQTLCQRQVSPAPLPHCPGHMELSLPTPFSSWRFFLIYHSGHPVITQTFLTPWAMSHSLCCGGWQMLIIASLWYRVGCGASSRLCQVFPALERISEHYPILYMSVLALKNLMSWFLLHFFWYGSNIITHNEFTHTCPGSQ